MRTTTPLWHLFSGLFVNIHCLPDWNMDTQPGEIAASESLPGNAIESPSMITLGSLDGINSGVNALSSEIPKAEDISSSSDCAPPDTKPLPSSKKKARRDNMCPADRLQFKNGGEKGGPILPSAPSGQQGGVGGGNSGGGGDGGNDGSGQPRRVPILRFPSPEDPLRDVLIPEKIRPRENEEVCPYVGYHVPVCAREVDAYISTFPDLGDTILDPCHLCKISPPPKKTSTMFFLAIRFLFMKSFSKLMQRCEFFFFFARADEPLMGCLFMEGEIGFCCMMTAVAYVSALPFTTPTSHPVPWGRVLGVKKGFP